MMKRKILFLNITSIGRNQLKLTFKKFKQKLIIKLKCNKTNKNMRCKTINN